MYLGYSLDMKSIFQIAAFLIATSFVTSYSLAQDAAYLSHLEKITTINSYTPEKSSKHERGTKIIEDRIIDRKNRVIGDVLDVGFDQKGGILALEVELNKIKRSIDPIFIDYKTLEIESAGNGFRTGFNRDQIEEMLSSLRKSSNTTRKSLGGISIQKLLDADVKKSEIQKIGKVSDVLFDSVGSRAEYLFINMNYNGLRGAGVAIPFDQARFIKKGNTLEVLVDGALARAMDEYVRNRL